MTLVLVLNRIGGYTIDKIIFEETIRVSFRLVGKVLLSLKGVIKLVSMIYIPAVSTA